MQSNDIQNLTKLWEDHNFVAQIKTQLPDFNFNNYVGEVFSAGPSYYYLVDFYDRSLSDVSSSIRAIHGLDPETVTFEDIINQIHPEDINHVMQAESFAGYTFLPNKNFHLSPTLYKVAYSFRFKTIDKGYRLFLHQSITLSLDSEGRTGIALNIHTDISHITNENNYKVSFISLDSANPSFLNLSYEKKEENVEKFSFSRREIQIIKLLSEGKTSFDVGIELNIAIDTVKNHRKNMLRKSESHTSAELIKKCLSNGMI